MMGFTIDEVANRSPFRDYPPLGKLFLALSLMSASLLATSIVVPIIALATGLILLYISTGFRFPRVLFWVYVDSFIIILVSCIVIAFITSGRTVLSIAFGPIYLTLSAEGVNLAALLFFRTLAAFTALLFFATSTTVPHLFRALRQIKIPLHIVELAILIYRYSFLLVEEVARMYSAADSRLGFMGLRRSTRTFSTIIAHVFGRSMDMAERGEYALSCRNFHGTFPCFKQPRGITTLWVLLPALLFIALFVLNLFVWGLVLV